MMLRYVTINVFFLVVLFCLGREGLIWEAYTNDILYIIPAIALSYSLGMIYVWRDLTTAEWFAETCVALGLFGTAMGIWTAFSGIDPDMVGDVNSIGAVLGVLLTGLGAALWTTLTGVFCNIWLTANIRLREAYDA